MNCPKCNGILSAKESEGHIGFVCEICNGMWIPNKYIESLKHNYIFDPANFIETLSESYTETEHTCPSCNTNLHHSIFKEIELEWCKSCNGVWFDKNELNSLVELHKKETTAGEGLLVGVELFALFLSS